MRLLFTIPHYASLDPSEAGDRSHCSLAADLSPRVAALSACLTALHQLFGPSVCFIDHGRRMARSFEPAVPRALDVVVCTTRGRHLLDRLPVGARYYTHQPTAAEPLLLGFECHAVLRDRLGGYDYYGYLEDDLILHDPWFFGKLSWFNRHVGDDKLLQPNRYEAGLNHLVPKVYVDGDLDEQVTAPFQDVRDGGPLAGEVMGQRVAFQRALNPHSGCFFLNAHQMEHWVRQPHFTDRASSDPWRRRPRWGSCGPSGSTGRPPPTPIFSKSSTSAPAISNACAHRRRCRLPSGTWKAPLGKWGLPQAA